MLWAAQTKEAVVTLLGEESCGSINKNVDLLCVLVWCQGIMCKLEWGCIPKPACGNQSDVHKALLLMLPFFFGRNHEVSHCCWQLSVSPLAPGAGLSG